MDKVSLSEFRDARKHQQELYEQYKKQLNLMKIFTGNLMVRSKTSLKTFVKQTLH